MSATIVAMLSGARIDLLAPDWRAIELADVAYGLAAIRRFNGQSRRHVSVAEHSARVALLAPPRFRLAAQLHDAHEFAFGDWITPAVNAVAANLGPTTFDAIDLVKEGIDIAIARRVLATFGPAQWPDFRSDATEALALASEMRSPEVRRADRDALMLEMSGLGRAGTRAVIDFGAALPDESEAVRWLDLVKAACAERYGAPA